MKNSGSFGHSVPQEEKFGKSDSELEQHEIKKEQFFYVPESVAAVSKPFYKKQYKKPNQHHEEHNDFGIEDIKQ
jgi:hypothetical protein